MGGDCVAMGYRLEAFSVWAREDGEEVVEEAGGYVGLKSSCSW